ncbi:MAG TPA: MFS transporter, partial [Nitrospiraceae bacterium]|nr:MFS transporter [Nitrospiraceae bacterium]
MVRLPPCQIRGYIPDSDISRVAKKVEGIVKPIILKRDMVIVGNAERTPSVRWGLVSLSLSMLLSSLDTSIANV